MKCGRWCGTIIMPAGCHPTSNTATQRQDESKAARAAILALHAVGPLDERPPGRASFVQPEATAPGRLYQIENEGTIP